MDPFYPPIWVPLDEVVALLKHPNFYWGFIGQGYTRAKYINLHIDTRDNKCVVTDRDGNPIDLKHLRTALENPIMKNMNANAPLHD